MISFFLGLLLSFSFMSSLAQGEESLEGQLQENFLTQFMQGDTKSQLEQLLKNNPFPHMPLTQIQANLKGAVKDSLLESVFQRYPQIPSFLASWLKDPQAMPRFISLLNEKQKLKLYSGIFIALLIVTFVFNLMNSKGGLIKRIGVKLLIFMGGMVVNLGAFLLIFSYELAPTLRVLRTFIF